MVHTTENAQNCSRFVLQEIFLIQPSDSLSWRPARYCNLICATESYEQRGSPSSALDQLLRIRYLWCISVFCTKRFFINTAVFRALQAQVEWTWDLAELCTQEIFSDLPSLYNRAFGQFHFLRNRKLHPFIRTWFVESHHPSGGEKYLMDHSCGV